MNLGKLSVGERIAQWSVQTPEAPAIEYSGSAVTYAQLLQAVHRIGTGMHDFGVRPGSVVALDIERSMAAVQAMLATWSIGAAFLPLDPQWPPARRCAILADAHPALLIHGDSHSDQPLTTDIPHAGLSVLSAAVPDDAKPYFHLAPSLHEVAYVLYTSGSTGSPKGVLIEHAQLLNYVSGVSQTLDLGSSRRWGLLGSIAADLGYTALFGALFNGACLVIANAAEAQDGESFARFIREQAIDGLKIVPSHLEALLETDRPSVPRKLILGGEATPPALLERIAKVAPHCELHNHYGPTETTVGVMVHRVDLTRDAGALLPLSRVLPNCSVQVLDEHMRAVPVGAMGEVYIGGAQVCRGYVHARRDEAFVPDPVHKSERLYRTGDLAHVLPAGGIRLAGRADDQVKIQGFRVEPAEIEAALLLQSGVRQAAVVVRNKDTNPELAAFIVVTAAAAATRQQLKEALSTSLPAYMVPGNFVFVDELPRLGNGKIDRRSLLATPLTNAEPRQPAESDDPVQSFIARCMAELLKRPSIDADEDFFDLGGHSLLVIKLVARMRKHLGVEVSPAAVFDHSTPRALALVARNVPTSKGQAAAEHTA